MREVRETWKICVYVQLSQLQEVERAQNTLLTLLSL